ncbi:uncharacterized protein LOC115409729 [Salarias fasciatus]|uniref:uncharacterized protein LOC115409729 n=1 Tax=Salarias fasciatus TaxID=181472 RepID=UPI001176CB0C|nr:uncharacterized protein LOC115409729 [Salarias fasciatus]
MSHQGAHLVLMCGSGSFKFPSTEEQSAAEAELTQAGAASPVATPSPASQRSQRPSRTSSAQRQVTKYMESTGDDSDCVPGATESCSSETDEDGQKSPSSPPHPPFSPKKDGGVEIAAERSSEEEVYPTKTILRSRRKRRSSSDSPEKRSAARKKRGVQEISDSITILASSKSGARRVYNKRNYCLFCRRPASKIARHLEAVHGDVEEVARAFQFPKNSQERRNRLNILRRRGNFAHNAAVVKRGAGELQACYRPKQTRRAVDFSHCFHCQGLYMKKTLWKHMRTCPGVKERDESSGGRRRVRSRAAGISEGFRNFLSCLTHDEITEIVQNDRLLMRFGQHLYDRNGRRENRHDCIRRRLRRLGQLVLVARASTPIRTAEELVRPANFGHTVLSVKRLAGYDPQSNTLKKPASVLGVGRSLGVVCQLVRRETVSSVDGDWSLVRFAEEFRTIKNFKWKRLTSRDAASSPEDAGRNAPQILPLTQDVKRWDAYLDGVRAEAEAALRLRPSAGGYGALARATLAQAVAFNRRTAGQVSRMELASFRARKRSGVDEEMAACLTQVESKMCEFFTRVEVRGDGGGRVPVLLKPAVASALELLVETRELCGVPGKNVYVFARPGALSAYRGAACVQQLARQSGAKRPDVFTSARLRRLVATTSQLLGLQDDQADRLAGLLGLDVRVRRSFYRPPEGTLQLAKMSKILLALDNGKLSQLEGQTLEDVQIDPEERVDPEDMDSSGGERSASQETDDCDNETTDDEEEEEEEEEEPSKNDCLRCIAAEPHELRARSWTGVKNYVRNRITALKRSLLFLSRRGR